MSYSFSVKGATKALAAEAVAKELLAIVSGQPVHERDKSQVFGAAELAMEPLVDDPARDVAVSVQGSVSWDWTSPSGPEPGKEQITSVSINVSASLVTREA